MKQECKFKVGDKIIFKNLTKTKNINRWETELKPFIGKTVIVSKANPTAIQIEESPRAWIHVDDCVLANESSVKCGDIIEFDLGYKKLTYVVRNSYLQLKGANTNSLIFIILELDKYKLALEQYGYESPGSDWLEFKSEDFEAAGRLIKELHRLCALYREKYGTIKEEDSMCYVKCITNSPGIKGNYYKVQKVGPHYKLPYSDKTIDARRFIEVTEEEYLKHTKTESNPKYKFSEDSKNRICNRHFPKFTLHINEKMSYPKEIFPSINVLNVLEIKAIKKVNI